MHGEICIGDALNPDHPLNQKGGLVSRWLALPDQQRGVMFRDLCMRNHGVLTNGPLWQSAMGRTGGFGSLLLDGTNDYVSVGSVQGDHANLTFGAWARLDSAGSFPMLVAFQTTPSYALEIRGAGGGGTLQLIVGSRLVTTYGTSDVGTGWHRWIATTGPTGSALYRDGVSVGSDSTTAESAALQMAIGARVDGSFVWPGPVDDIVLASRPWSAAEVAADYAESRQSNPDTLNWIRRPWMAPAVGGVTGSPWYYHLQQRAAA